MGLVGNVFLVWGRRLIRRPVRVHRFLDIWYLGYPRWSCSRINCLLGWSGLITFMYTCVLATATLWCVDSCVPMECYAVIRSCTLAYLYWIQLDSTWRHLKRWRPQSLQQKVNSSVNTMQYTCAYSYGGRHNAKCENNLTLRSLNKILWRWCWERICWSGCSYHLIKPHKFYIL